MSIIEIILSSNTALCVTIVPDLCQSTIQEIQRNNIAHTNNKNVILVLHILVCTKWIVSGCACTSLVVHVPL